MTEQEVLRAIRLIKEKNYAAASVQSLSGMLDGGINTIQDNWHLLSDMDQREVIAAMVTRLLRTQKKAVADALQELSALGVTADQEQAA